MSEVAALSTDVGKTVLTMFSVAPVNVRIDGVIGVVCREDGFLNTIIMTKFSLIKSGALTVRDRVPVAWVHVPVPVVAVGVPNFIAFAP